MPAAKWCGGIGMRGAEPWRLIDTEEHDGATNMAVDVAIQRLRRDGVVSNAIHIYDWDPPAVSIGSKQHAENAVNLHTCRRDGLDVVRRPTGGRAVVHAGDFTFSMIATAGGAIPATVKRSYAVTSRIAALALARLGVSAQVGSSSTAVSPRGACFLTSTLADLVVGGRKIAGAAQAWDGNVLLQQNSILIHGDRALGLVYLRGEPERGPDENAVDLRRKTCSLAGLLGRAPKRREIVEAIASAAGEILGIDVVTGDLTHREWALARELAPSYRLPREPMYRL